MERPLTAMERPLIIFEDDRVDRLLRQPVHEFAHQHAGHHRVAGEMPLEEGFIDRNVFQGDNPMSWLQFHHTIHHDERIAMRQDTKEEFVVGALQAVGYMSSFERLVLPSLPT